MRKGTRLIAAVIAAQALVPALALLHAPHQYGFQMYSGLEWVEVRVTDAAGKELDANPVDYVARFRGDVDWTQDLPESLCQQVTAASIVTVTRHSDSRSVSCH